MLKIIIWLSCICTVMAQSGPDSLCLRKAEKAFSNENYREALVLVSGCSQGKGAFRIKGLSYHGLYQADSAVVYLQKAADAPEAGDSVLLGCAEALLWKKDFKAALGMMSRTADKKDADYKRIAALYLEMMGKFAEASAYYDTLLLQDKRPWNTLLRKAQVLSWMKHFDESIELFTKILTYPEAPKAVKMTAILRRAEVAAWQKKTGKALHELDSLIAANSALSTPSAELDRLLEAWQLKGRFLEWEGRFPEAKEAYKNILLKRPDNKQAQMSLENLLWVK
ncbi:MAG: hypothetical protein V1913_02320 [Fibrobacterota bacterium]